LYARARWREGADDRAVRRHGAVGSVRRNSRDAGDRAIARGDDRGTQPEGRGSRGDTGRFLHAGAWGGVMTTVAELPAAFADKVLSAQSTFRSVMNAMARPGSVQRIVALAGTPDGVMRGTAAIAPTLFDHDTPIWLDAAMSGTSEVARWLKFHTSAPVISDSS